MCLVLTTKEVQINKNESKIEVVKRCRPVAGQIYHKGTHPLENWSRDLTLFLVDFLVKNPFLDILEIFWLNIGQISFNLVQKTFAT